MFVHAHTTPTGQIRTATITTSDTEPAFRYGTPPSLSGWKVDPAGAQLVQHPGVWGARSTNPDWYAHYTRVRETEAAQRPTMQALVEHLSERGYDASVGWAAPAAYGALVQDPGPTVGLPEGIWALYRPDGADEWFLLIERQLDHDWDLYGALADEDGHTLDPGAEPDEIADALYVALTEPDPAR